MYSKSCWSHNPSATSLAEHKICVQQMLLGNKSCWAQNPCAASLAGHITLVLQVLLGTESVRSKSCWAHYPSATSLARHRIRAQQVLQGTESMHSKSGSAHNFFCPASFAVDRIRGQQEPCVLCNPSRRFDLNVPFMLEVLLYDAHVSHYQH